MAETVHLYRTIALHVPLTPQQRNVVFQHTGKQVTELALTADELKAVVPVVPVNGPTQSMKLILAQADVWEPS